MIVLRTISFYMKFGAHTPYHVRISN